MRMKLITIIVLSLFSYSSASFTQEEAPRFVSIVSLISNPDEFDGKAVHVIGVVNLEFEGNQVCLRKEDITLGITKNCLWISLDTETISTPYDALLELNGKYTLIFGTFNKNNHGHMGMNSGAIEHITRYDLWER